VLRIGAKLAAALTVLSIAVVGLLVGCLTSRDGRQSLGGRCLRVGDSASTVPQGPALVALSSNNHLLRISVPSGRIEATRRLGSRPETSAVDDPRLRVPGSLLARDPGGDSVWALVRQPVGGRDAVTVVDAATLKIRCRLPLERRVRYRGLALGASGRLYAYGYRQAGDPEKLAAVLTVLDIATGAVVESRTVRRPNSDWFVYWGALGPDERHLALSYHGGSTGADWLTLSDDTIKRCRSRGRAIGCVYEVHGAVESFGAGFIATTGSDVLEVGWDGDIVRRLQVKARLVHLMNFALDAGRSLLYVSSCGRRPAIHRLDLARGGLRVLPSGRFCGEPLAVYGDRFLVLAAAHVDEAGVAGDIEGLRLVDLEHPGAGTPLPGSALPQDALFIGP
jgi:hypothetical protein